MKDIDDRRICGKNAALKKRQKSVGATNHIS